MTTLDYAGPLTPAEETHLPSAFPSDLSAWVLGDLEDGERYQQGAYYTPKDVVDRMCRDLLVKSPETIVDAGCGSGRFGHRLRELGFAGRLICIDRNPRACVATRQRLRKWAHLPTQVVHANFLTWEPPTFDRVGFIGNPPYCRHHDIAPEDKREAKSLAAAQGLSWSGLAGLHALFVLKMASLCKTGDAGVLILPSEWLVTGYGASLRQVLSTTLGLESLEVFSPDDPVFAGVLTTACIAQWQVGAHSPVCFTRDGTEEFVPRAALGTAPWRPSVPEAAGVRLADLVTVKRGIATGANHFFVIDDETRTTWSLHSVTRPVLHRAKQVQSNPRVAREHATKWLVLIPPDTNDPKHLAYLEHGRAQGLHQRYLCRHRHPWWKMPTRRAPDIVVTYMTRTGMKAAVNRDGLPIVNVFLGLHFLHPPKNGLAERIVDWLNAHTPTGGRTYAGGLQKFEPSELAELRIPESVVTGARLDCEE